MTNAPLSRADAAARVRAEGPVRLDQVAVLIRADHSLTGHVSVSTLLRWIVGGKRGVRLEAARIKGDWHTSLAALQRFRVAAGV